MIPVGHFHYCFFERSETFIHHQLSSLKRFRPVAISLISRNLNEFPLPNGVHYDVGLELSRPGLQFIEPFRYGSLKLAAELFKREGVALIHAHFGTWGAYAIPLQKSLRVPMVVTFYGQDMSLLPKRTMWRNRFQKLWKKIDLFLVEGPHMMAELIKLGAPREKVALQRIGVPVSKIGFHPPATKSTRPPTALWVGRMIEKKGLMDALKALESLKREGIKIQLRIIGDGPERRKAQGFVKEKGSEEDVTFLGFLDYETYLAELERVDFFLAPSKTSGKGETEGGAPTTILEAEARGLPVVATRHADIPFVLPEGYPYLANEADPRDLARVIKLLLDDRKRWPQIARKNRKHVERFHDLKATTQSLEKHYDRLLTKRVR
ncbi:MAG: glycosyltransferase [candidate division WOR-3 bacterium]|nr:glycosyltransferase [candidate division WOR-3 bacterium]